MADCSKTKTSRGEAKEWGGGELSPSKLFPVVNQGCQVFVRLRVSMGMRCDEVSCYAVQYNTKRNRSFCSHVLY